MRRRFISWLARSERLLLASLVAGSLALHGCRPELLPSELQELHDRLEEAAAPGPLSSAGKAALEKEMRELLLPALESAGAVGASVEYREDGEHGFTVVSTGADEEATVIELYYRPHLNEALRDALDTLEDTAAAGAATEIAGRFEIRAFAPPGTGHGSPRPWIEALPLSTLERL